MHRPRGAIATSQKTSRTSSCQQPLQHANLRKAPRGRISVTERACASVRWSPDEHQMQVQMCVHGPCPGAHDSQRRLFSPDGLFLFSPFLSLLGDALVPIARELSRGPSAILGSELARQRSRAAWGSRRLSRSQSLMHCVYLTKAGREGEGNLTHRAPIPQVVCNIAAVGGNVSWNQHPMTMRRHCRCPCDASRVHGARAR